MDPSALISVSATRSSSSTYAWGAAERSETEFEIVKFHARGASASARSHALVAPRERAHASQRDREYNGDSRE